MYLLLVGKCSCIPASGDLQVRKLLGYNHHLSRNQLLLGFGDASSISALCCRTSAFASVH